MSVICASMMWHGASYSWQRVMKAIILVGGYGTRMRPLTFTCPKPIFPFVNQAPIENIVKALSEVGVKEVILGFDCQCNRKITQTAFKEGEKPTEPINEQAARIMKQLAPMEAKYGVKFTYSQKHEALGTAGPIKYAQKELTEGNSDNMFFVFNSDVICNYPLKELIEFHKSSGGEASILLAEVADPSRFGVVVRNEENGKVDRFVEKPKEFVGNKINAGIYVLNNSVIDRIPERFTMIETEVFPQLAQEGKLFSLRIKDNFWYDIGKPADYILAQGAHLNYYKVQTHEKYSNAVFIDSTTQIGKDCQIGPNVVIGPKCIIGNGVRLSNCTIVGSTTVSDFAYIKDSIVSWDCSIGTHARVQGLTCLAEDVMIKPQVRVTKCMVCSHKSIGADVEGQTLM